MANGVDLVDFGEEFGKHTPATSLKRGADNSEQSACASRSAKYTLTKSSADSSSRDEEKGEIEIAHPQGASYTSDLENEVGE